MSRPALFIGCSSEAHDVAAAIQENLDNDFESQIWTQGVFGLTKGYLESLIEIGQTHQFAVIILTPDDMVESRGETLASPRDNVIFEIGLFIGALGRDRTYIVYDRDVELKIPSDLAGLSLAGYSKPNLTDWTGAVGGVCNKIRRAANEVMENDIKSSPKTPYNEKVDDLVKSALKVVCRALTTPMGFDIAKLRAFIFKKEESELICSHFWSPNPVREAVGHLKFEINSETQKEVAVVEAVVSQRVVAVDISPLSNEVKEEEDGHFDIEEKLCFVLAAPITGPNGEVWGIVDIDTSTIEGMSLLQEEMAKSVILELGKHLYLALEDRK